VRFASLASFVSVMKIERAANGEDNEKRSYDFENGDNGSQLAHNRFLSA
jgi:hypothetical protein